jgi:integrase
MPGHRKHGRLIFKRPDSPFWYFRVRDADGRIAEGSTKVRHDGGDREAALNIARAKQRDAVAALHPGTNTTTIGEAWDRFLASKGDRSAGTHHFYGVKAGHLLRYFDEEPRQEGEGGKMRLARIDAKAVDAYTAHRREEGAHPNTIAKELTVLRGILRLARRHGDYHLEPSQVMPIAFDAEYVPRDRWLPPDEVDALVAALLAPDNADDEGMPENRAAFVLFAVATGARLGEIRRAQRGDVDMEARLVHLRGTKTTKAKGAVPILPHALPMLRRVLKLTAGRKGLLFHPWYNVIRDLEAACAQAKIEKATPNDLRRTLGKWLRRAGVSPDLIGEALRHVDGRMAKKVYGQMTPAELGAVLRSGAYLGRNNRRSGRKVTQPATSRS